MKNIKKFFLTMAMTMALGTSAFAASGFEFLLNVPFGMNVGIPKSAKNLVMDSGGSQPIGADVGIDAQIGYMFQVKENLAISVLGELGYSYDSYGFDYGASDTISGVSYSYNISCKQSYHSFKLGLLPKFNIGVGNGAIAIGIGGGVKIPCSGKLKTRIGDININGNNAGLEDKREIDITRKDITDTFSPSIIGYLKVTFDYYLFFTDNIAMNFGLYLGGDFGPNVKDLKIVTSKIPLLSPYNMPISKDSKIGANAFEIGLQIGFRYGLKA